MCCGVSHTGLATSAGTLRKKIHVHYRDTYPISDAKMTPQLRSRKRIIPFHPFTTWSYSVSSVTLVSLKAHFLSNTCIRSGPTLAGEPLG
jgi:hypothetical protein